MNQITIMLLAPERARADVMFCADRAYYHFATDSSTEDGDLPGLGDRINDFGERLLQAVASRPGETPLESTDGNSIGTSEVGLRIFVDNVEQKRSIPLTRQGLQRLTRILGDYDDSLAFFTYF